MAALDAIEHGEVVLDWPNDLFVGDAKVGGLLAEVAQDVAVFGLGVNLWWPDPRPSMAGLFDSDPGEAMASRIAGRFASSMLELLEAGPLGWDRGAYVARCVTIGALVSWENGAGRAVDIAANGALVVETTTGRVELHSSSVGRVARGTVPPMRSPR
jgi:BirA family biotin operon repressor/biotin-[acetyl-CoA-carboxylase] ligase